MFSHDQPHQEMECLFRFKEIKTKKWTERGFNSAFKKLLRPVDPTIKMKAKVKLESMHLRPDGYPKAPRLLIADGDQGHTTALLTMASFQRLLFGKYRREKGVPGQD